MRHGAADGRYCTIAHAIPKNSHVLVSTPEKRHLFFCSQCLLSSYVLFAGALMSLLSLSLPPSRSPPRPTPGCLHYSDEDVSTKYNDLRADSSSLTEKPSEMSDSQVQPHALKKGMVI